MRPHTTTSCFATYMLPHVLFVADFEEHKTTRRPCWASLPPHLARPDRGKAPALPCLPNPVTAKLSIVRWQLTLKSGRP